MRIKNLSKEKKNSITWKAIKNICDLLPAGRDSGFFSSVMKL
jgi:hypothetical protein